MAKKKELDDTRCIKSIHEGGRWPRFHQCHRKRGFGEKGEYCKQHAQAIERQKLCCFCKGSGKCRDCNGNGKYTCKHCGTQDVLCYDCEQTGVCNWCKGTGKD